MKIIEQEIQIGPKDVELFLEATIEGEVIVSKKADSLVNTFLQTLYAMMANKYLPDQKTIYSRGSLAIDDTYLWDVTGVTNVSPNKVRINHSGSSSINSTWSYVYIYGVEGRPEINGLHPYTFISNGVIDLDDLVGNDAAITLRNAKIGIVRIDQDVRPNNTAFSSPDMRLGTDSTAVNIDDRVLGNQIGTGTGDRQLTMSTVSVSLPAVGLSTSEITISRDFTNNSGADISFSEVGLFMLTKYDSFDGKFGLMARDVIAAVTIPNGKTVTVSYRIRTSVTNDAGVPIQFNEILYRQITGNSRESKDVNNINRVNEEAVGQFLTVNCGGDNSPYSTPTTAGSLFGPQIGSSTKIVEISDIRLQDGAGAHTAFLHGRGANQVLHYGTFIEDWTIDAGVANEAYFNIYKLFENVSGAAITVNEVGLYCGGYSTTVPIHPHCFGRNRLAAAITLNNGEILKVVYKIKLVA